MQFITHTWYNHCSLLCIPVAEFFTEQTLEILGMVVAGGARDLAEGILGWQAEYRKLLITTRIDGERAGLAANLGTEKVKNTITGEDVWAFHDKGHGRQLRSHQKAGKHTSKWLVCVCEAKEVGLEENRNEEPMILSSPEAPELMVNENVWTSSILVKDHEGTDVYMKERRQICLKDLCKAQKVSGRILGALSSAKLEMLELALIGGDKVTAKRTQLLKKRSYTQ